MALWDEDLRRPISFRELHTAVLAMEVGHGKRGLLANNVSLLGGCFAKNHIDYIERHQSPTEAECRYVGEREE